MKCQAVVGFVLIVSIKAAQIQLQPSRVFVPHDKAGTKADPETVGLFFLVHESSFFYSTFRALGPCSDRPTHHPVGQGLAPTPTRALASLRHRTSPQTRTSPPVMIFIYYRVYEAQRNSCEFNLQYLHFTHFTTRDRRGPYGWRLGRK